MRRPAEIHRGIRIDAIPVRGVVGLIFMIGVLGILYVELPHIRQFIWLALLPGVSFGLYRIWRQK